MPVFLFVILFGLSMDYHVFILSRIKELHDAGATTDDAIRLAITRTAGTVTSAAIIMTCTGGVLSEAGTLEAVVDEIASTRVTERGETRADDRVSEAAMEDRKRVGYF